MHTQNNTDDTWPSLVPHNEDDPPYTIQISMAYTKNDSFRRFGKIFRIQYFSTLNEAENYQRRFEEFLREFIIDHRSTKSPEWHIWVTQPIQIFSATPAPFITPLGLKIAAADKVSLAPMNNFSIILREMIGVLKEIAKNTEATT